MARDYFAVLGLTPGRHDPREVARRFLAERQRLLGELDDPTKHTESRRRLDQLHLAFAALRDPRRQEDYLRARSADVDRVAALRRLIADSLEDGLLRYSRRQAILERARELGLSEFQAQLLIAQVQFGDHEITALPELGGPRKAPHNPRAWARPAAVGVLALGMFLYLVRWLGG